VTAPSWWQPGVEVVNSAGIRGRLEREPDGAWRIQLLASDSYVVNPDPGQWFEEIQFEINPMQVRQVLYEVDRAFLMARGRSGLLEWASVPQRIRVAAAEPRPCPLETDGLAPIRARLIETVRQILAPHIR